MPLLSILLIQQCTLCIVLGIHQLLTLWACLSFLLHPIMLLPSPSQSNNPNILVCYYMLYNIKIAKFKVIWNISFLRGSFLQSLGDNYSWLTTYLTLVEVYICPLSSYHYVHRWKPFQHAVRSQQWRAVRILKHRRALHPHLSQLLWTQWLKPKWKIPPSKLWSILSSRGWYGQWRQVIGHGRISILGEEETHIFWLNKRRDEKLFRGSWTAMIKGSIEQVMEIKYKKRHKILDRQTGIYVDFQHFVLVKMF